MSLEPSAKIIQWMVDLSFSLKKVSFSGAVKIRYFAKTIWRLKLK